MFDSHTADAGAQRPAASPNDSRTAATRNHNGHAPSSNGSRASEQGRPSQPTASRNGHVSGSDKAEGDPYLHGPYFPREPLAADHRAHLEECGLSTEAIAARGYWTCDDRAHLKHLGFPANLGRSLMIPLLNYRGEASGHTARPDIPHTPRTGKPRKYLQPMGAAQVLDVAPLTREHIDDPARPLIITEGAKKADAAASHGLCAININGVDGSRGRNAKGGVTALADWQSIALKGSRAPGRAVEGREVIVAFDSDVSSENPHVERALRKLCALLQALGARVKVAYLEPGPNGEKTGLDDFFARGGTVEELRALARDLEPPEESRRKQKEKKSAQVLEELHQDGRPVVEVNDRQLAHILDDLSGALAAFNAGAPQLFHGAAGLVKIERERDGAPVLNLVTSEGLQVLVGRAAWFKATTEQGGVRHTKPPKDLCANYLASRADWRGVPAIDGIATAPFFDARGVLCATPGFHAEARTWLALPSGFALPDTTPTPANVEAAKRLLLGELLGEVAFANQASRAGALALMLLPFVRRLIPEPTPLHLFDAPTQASGKTYAATICLEPFGEVIPTTEKKDAEENRKALSSTLASGAAVILIDNVRGTLGDSTLAAALTTNKFRGRLIGTGQDIIFDCSRVVWAATSNNAQLDADAASRAIVIQLDTDSENPEAREFKGDPLALIRRGRGAVIGAIVTLVRAWQEAGAPNQKKKCRTRFKMWERVLGGILDVAHVPGFLDNHSEAREAASPQAAAWREFTAAWHKAHGSDYVTAKQVLAIALECEELAALIGSKQEAQAKTFGEMLRDQRGKIFGALKIARAEQRSKAGMRWRVVPMDVPPKPAQPEAEGEADAAEEPSKGVAGVTGVTPAGERGESDFPEHYSNNLQCSGKSIIPEEPDRVTPVTPATPFEEEEAAETPEEGVL
jgi:hypothetical protein